MQRLTKEHLFFNRGDLATLPPAAPLKVGVGESFLIETTDTANKNIQSEQDAAKPRGPMAGNPWTGPVYVEGIRAGEVIAVHIEQIAVVDHCFLALGEETMLPAELFQERRDFVRIAGGMAHFPGGLAAPIRPMYGCFGVTPLVCRADPWTHGGNLDLPSIAAGSIVHLRCERDGALFACGDAHALQGEAEINGFSLEVSTVGQIRIERSPYQQLPWMLIETPGEYIAVGVRHELEASVKDAAWTLSWLLAEHRGISLPEAYQFASHVGDLRLGPLWPVWGSKRPIPVPVCLHLSKAYFRGNPEKPFHERQAAEQP